jgi:hypothetical protein
LPDLVITLRRQVLSSYEISARLSAEGTPLNRTSVAEIGGLATGEEAIFDLDFHAIMYWGRDRPWKSTTCLRGPSGPGRC